MVVNKALVFNKVPEGLPVAGEHIAVETVADYDETAPAPEGGVLLKNVYASLDPYMRGRMRKPEKESYNNPLEIGKPIGSRTIATVLKSDNPKYKPGDVVNGKFLPMQQYVSVSGPLLDYIEPLSNPLEIEDIRVFLGALGMPGTTAYASLYEIGQPKKGETIFISAASGAVGGIVGQLAKREGLRVIGSVGSDEKLDFIINELGFDAGFNYKKETPQEALKRLAPEGIDINYENVGGEHLSAAIDALKPFGRIILCGLISQYNSGSDVMPLTNYSQLLTKRIRMQGFIVGDPNMAGKWGKEHQERVQQWVKEGSMKAVTWECDGIDNAAEGLLALFSGKNLGKVVLKF